MKTPKILVEILRTSSINFVEADENYSVFHLKSGSKVVSGYTLKFHVDQLDKHTFLRVNRSMLVNRKYIKSVMSENSSSFAILQDGRSIPIPRRRLKIFQEAYDPKVILN
ncbi:LytTr DNA-binding domain-containing protein [Spirosomataceae bacterium TFI 002]|nr:LytTr DNA-binding domain-containing protein [Spirosomataceae bacterium TFI 002]